MLVVLTLRLVYWKATSVKVIHTVQINRLVGSKYASNHAFFSWMQEVDKPRLQSSNLEQSRLCYCKSDTIQSVELAT